MEDYMTIIYLIHQIVSHIYNHDHLLLNIIVFVFYTSLAPILLYISMALNILIFLKQTKKFFVVHFYSKNIEKSIWN